MDSTNQEPPLTFYFAHEIETALVAMCLSDPDLLPTVLAQLDPALHFTQAPLRQVLEALNIAVRELGLCDLPTLSIVLRELGHLEAIGGKEGLAQLYELYRYGWSSKEAQNAIFAHYLDMLKRYALARASNVPVFYFNRGDITLSPNKARANPRSPHYLGSGKVAGRLYSASTYQTQNGILSVSLLPK